MASSSPASENLPYDAVTDRRPPSHSPGVSALSRQRPRLPLAARMPGNRTAKLGAQPALRSFTPPTTPLPPAKTVAATAAITHPAA